ncbi:unnamed protein product [Caenorhabditis angaria]|uniref:Uncharacterized protein n=1 Tax=Caenorhabditis angaria TaxID=860376 RepID=A0A9P1MTI0_9PELO|nr:unnamed protein product [Caenorhabditis angaria]
MESTSYSKSNSTPTCPQTSTPVSTPSHNGPFFMANQHDLSLLFETLAIKSCKLSGTAVITPIEPYTFIDLNIEIFDRRLSLEKFTIDVKRETTSMRTVYQKNEHAINYIVEILESGEYTIKGSYDGHKIFTHLLGCEHPEEMQMDENDSALNTLSNINSSIFQNTTNVLETTYETTQESGIGSTNNLVQDKAELKKELREYLKGVKYNECRLFSSPGKDSGNSKLSTQGYNELFSIFQNTTNVSETTFQTTQESGIGSTNNLVQDKAEVPQSMESTSYSKTRTSSLKADNTRLDRP